MLITEIIRVEAELKSLLRHAISQTLQYARPDCEQKVGALRKLPPEPLMEAFKVMTREIDETSRNCIGLIEGVADEIIMAANSDRTATSLSERPGYVWNSVFHAHVRAVAQGDGATANSGSVKNAGINLPELIRLIHVAADEWPVETRAQAAGAQAAIEAETKAPVPDIGFLRSAVGKIGAIAGKVTETVGTQALLAYLKAHGLL